MNKIEAQERLNTVIRFITMGITKPDNIFKIVTSDSNPNQWKCSRRNFYNYFLKAKNYFIKQSEINRQELIGIGINRLEELYESARKIQDFKTALSIQKEINNMFGLSFENELIRKVDEILSTKNKGYK